MLKVNKNIFEVLHIELSQEVCTTAFSTGKDNHSPVPWDYSAIGLERPQVLLVQPLAPSRVRYKMMLGGSGIYPVLKMSINGDYSASRGSLCCW